MASGRSPSLWLKCPKALSLSPLSCWPQSMFPPQSCQNVLSEAKAWNYLCPTCKALMLPLRYSSNFLAWPSCWLHLSTPLLHLLNTSSEVTVSFFVSARTATSSQWHFSVGPVCTFTKVVKGKAFLFVSVFFFFFLSIGHLFSNVTFYSPVIFSNPHPSLLLLFLWSFPLGLPWW